MKHAAFLAVTICVLFLGNIALADWDPTEPAKYFQLPDKTEIGMDVKVGLQLPFDPQGTGLRKRLADDFPCHQRGLITDIHIWGSWKDDVLPQDTAGQAGPGKATFILGIWDDIPATGPAQGEHSRPGTLLKDFVFTPGQYQVRRAFEGPEDWYNPNTGEWINDNHDDAYQYNFFIDRDRAFMQEGETAAGEPTIYWLSVDVIVHDFQGEAEFGWKTSEEHWNDDATWMDAEWIPDGLGGGSWQWLGGWNELRYPFGHEMETESIDLAFAITPEPATMSLLGLGGLFVLRRRRRK